MMCFCYSYSVMRSKRFCNLQKAQVVCRQVCPSINFLQQAVKCVYSPTPTNAAPLLLPPFQAMVGFLTKTKNRNIIKKERLDYNTNKSMSDQQFLNSFCHLFNSCSNVLHGTSLVMFTFWWILRILGLSLKKTISDKVVIINETKSW